jgi:hypothetical protein
VQRSVLRREARCQRGLAGTDGSGYRNDEAQDS